MPGITQTLSTLNSLLRTGLAIVIVGLLGAGGWYGYQVYNADEVALQEKEQQLVGIRNELKVKQGLLDTQAKKLQEQDEQIVALNADLQEKEAKIQKLDTSLRLLKVSHRVGWLTVLEQDVDPQTNQLFTVGQFVEVNESGEAIGTPKQFRINGDVVYIDNWVVKFDDEYVERAEIDRATSLVLFRRIFGEDQTPNEGYVIDAVGSRPQAYGRGSEMSEFEKKIWDDFWTIANDQARAQELGIRAAHGEAPSMKLQKGKSYKVVLRAADGLSITPDSSPPPIVGKPAA
ncbi:MAG: hypothetical protein ACYC0X_17525 [Pirellulaceae bacterium]